MLTYAIDRGGRFVNVDDVANGQDCNCICPACKEPLIAKNSGSIRVHHFAHQSGSECKLAYETMLHLCAKTRLQSAFLNAECFYVDYEYKSYCSNEKQCKYEKIDHCYTLERKRFNLKEYYDSCEQEVAYDKSKRRSDLKLYSSTAPDRQPLYVEFCVTHACDEEKLHSGNKIIECVIEDESDIDNLIANGFVEDNHVPSKVKIYGFRNTDYNGDRKKTRIVFWRYMLYPSGKSRCCREVCYCKDLKRSSENTLYEVCFHTHLGFDIYEYAKYLGYDKYHIPNCSLCRKYVTRYYGTGKICTSYKYLNIPLDEQFDTSRAKQCPRFSFNRKEYEQMKRQGVDVPVDEM